MVENSPREHARGAASYAHFSRFTVYQMVFAWRLLTGWQRLVGSYRRRTALQLGYYDPSNLSTR
ncbi:protein of unknown function (plasmid) [Cupriavidus taiwanensis]|uniref:Uncharacterized protein n=1 Tax=Cupriavidus taiwanensis TaxID=164546 RepID=A0A375IMD0_9BURK|nr:protein of unknown function [Cupriavidus taiwanensis]